MEIDTRAPGSQLFGPRTALRDELASHENADLHGDADLHEDAAVLDGAAVPLVDELLHEAARAGASDLHFEPSEDGLRVRYRLDGRLMRVGVVPSHRQGATLARLKVLASLDLAEKRRPQDGRFSFTLEARTLDVRVSTVPATHGEKVVLRLLDRERLPLDLTALGMPAPDRAAFLRAIERPHGLVLVTGPTGSGKTTTLYAALQHLNTPDRNLLTIEDPAEYRLAGVNQSSVRPDLGFTFANALRAFLRQDPDVIMVGEIRDAETAEIAVRAALTGHLVLSTLHTNDAPSTVSRLFDVGVEPFLLASCLRLVIAQRLVRKVCDACAVPQALTEEARSALQLDVDVFRQGTGCAVCHGTGYQGRVPLFETLPVNEALSELISRRASTDRLREHARDSGMMTLRGYAALLVAQGVTTPAEVLRETT